MRIPSALAIGVVAVMSGACGRDGGGLLPAAAAGSAEPMLRTSELQAGGTTTDLPARNPYAGDANAAAQGRELYAGMNCAGCHGPNGGGGIGPPFADADWIYGDQPENIVQSILQGRPNGMPAFGPKLPASEAWKIATFVQELSKKAAGAGDSPAIGSSKGTSKGGSGR